MSTTTTAELISAGPIVAFNAITLEHAEAIVAGAERAGRAVVISVSENAVKYRAGALAPLAAALREIAVAADVPVALHLDHVEDFELARQAPACGIASVMVDAGRLPYSHNVQQTAAQAAWLHERSVFVEAELGYVGGKESQVQSAHSEGIRTDPGQGAEFVAATGVDALAVAVGSSHAMTSRTASLDLGLIAALRDAVPVPLVLHGSSGVPHAELRGAVQAGIRKINVGTALNVAFTEAVREGLAASGSVDPRRYLAAARDRMAETVAELIGVVSSA